MTALDRLALVGAKRKCSATIIFSLFPSRQLLNANNSVGKVRSDQIWLSCQLGSLNR